MIDAATFRKVRVRTLKAALPGFTEAKGVYTRSTGGQIQVVQFASQKYGGAYTIDLGLHFDGIPPFPSRSGARVATGADPCWITQRLRHGDDDQFWAYGETSEVAETTLRTIAQGALAAFDEQARWGDGQALLTALPPGTLRSDEGIFESVVAADTLEERERRSATMIVRKLFPGWYPMVGSTALLLAHVAHRGKRSPTLVREYLDLFADARGGWGPPWQALAESLTAN